MMVSAHGFLQGFLPLELADVCRTTIYDIACTDNSSAYRSKIWQTFDRQLNYIIKLYSPF